MNRYDNSVDIIIDVNTGKRRYETMYYPTFEKTVDDVYIISRRGDRLDLLAHQYYDDETLWWIIAVSNNLDKGTFAVEPGIRIRIPALTNSLLLKNKMREAQL